MPRQPFTSFTLSLLISLIPLAAITSPSAHRADSPGDVVISQIFGGGGNSGAPLRNDFVELFNRSATPVSLTGYSIQYVSATGSSWSKAELTGQIAPGQYYLIQLASGGAVGGPLPAPDAAGSLALAATAGKVALVKTTVSLNGACPTSASIVDLVGYGTTASCFEGDAPAPAPSATRAVLRAGEGCTDTDHNQADFTAIAPAPRNAASPLHPCSTIPRPGARVTPDDLKITISEAQPCAPLAVAVQITNSGEGAQRDNDGPEAIIDFPADLMIAAGGCRAGTGVCTLVSVSRLEWNGALGPGETVVIEFDPSISPSVAPGERRCLEATVRYDGDDDGVNESMTVASECAAANCPAAGPGLAIAASLAPDTGNPGSILVYPFYISNAANAQAENTRLSLTNTHPLRSATVHLFLIDESSPQIADAFLCLTTNQTRSFLASDIDPNVAGYAIAVAVDEMTGCPVNFNHLIGDTYIKLASGHSAGLAAIAFAAISATPAVCESDAISAEIRFDGASYSAAPRTLAIDSLPSPDDGYDSLLVVDRLGGNLLTGAATIGQVAGLVFNDVEEGFSFSWTTSRRQFRSRISASFPRTAPRLDAIIPSGRTGWMKFWRATDGALVGVRLTAHRGVGISATAHAGGGNLRVMTLTAAATIIVPVMTPKC